MKHITDQRGWWRLIRTERSLSSIMRLCAIIFLAVNTVGWGAAFDYTVLNTLFREQRTIGDLVTSLGFIEIKSPVQFAYVAQKNGEGVECQALYTVQNNLTKDVMDSQEQNPRGYSFKYSLGGIYKSEGPGMHPLYDYVRADDHATAGAQFVESYERGRLLGYAYPRYGNVFEDNLVVEESGVILRFNRVYGAALWNIEYDGLQFINNFGLGRQVQASCRWWNPDEKFQSVATEVGKQRLDFSLGLDAYPAGKHIGVPVVYADDDQEANTVRTCSIPIEFKEDATQRLGGGKYSPVIYDSIACYKELTYDFDGLGPVFRFKTTWRFPEFKASSSDLNKRNQMEMGLHLVKELNSVYRYHAATDELESMHYKWDPASYDRSTNRGFNDNKFEYGCYIFANESESHCLGVMVKNRTIGGSWEHVMALRFDQGDPGGEFDQSCNLIFFLNWQDYEQGNNDYYYYMMVGDLETVLEKARLLYAKRDQYEW